MSGSEKGRRSTLLILAFAGALVVVLGAAMYIYDHSRRDLIADGVRIDGVSVGGLHASAARTKVQAELGTRLSRPVRVRRGSQVWTLNAREAHLTVDVDEHGRPGRERQPGRLDPDADRQGAVRGQRQPRYSTRRQLLPPGGARADGEGARGGQSAPARCNRAGRTRAGSWTFPPRMGWPWTARGSAAASRMR